MRDTENTLENTIDLYTLNADERYTFRATVNTFSNCLIRPQKHYANGYNKLLYARRIEFYDSEILIGSEFQPFEDYLMMDAVGKFKNLVGGDIVAFDAQVGFVHPYYADYPEDNRGKYYLRVEVQDWNDNWEEEYSYYGDIFETSKQIGEIQEAQIKIQNLLKVREVTRKVRRPHYKGMVSGSHYVIYVIVGQISKKK